MSDMDITVCNQGMALKIPTHISPWMTLGFLRGQLACEGWNHKGGPSLLAGICLDCQWYPCWHRESAYLTEADITQNLTLLTRDDRAPALKEHIETGAFVVTQPAGAQNRSALG